MCFKTYLNHPIKRHCKHLQRSQSHSVELIFTNSALWAELIRESTCPSVCLSVCVSPSHAIFFEASDWSSDHMTRSRPLIGQPSFPTIWWWWWCGGGIFFYFLFIYFFFCSNAPCLSSRALKMGMCSGVNRVSIFAWTESPP
jgi:hypothetical protein